MPPLHWHDLGFRPGPPPCRVAWPCVRRLGYPRPWGCQARLLFIHFCIHILVFSTGPMSPVISAAGWPVLSCSDVQVQSLANTHVGSSPIAGPLFFFFLFFPSSCLFLNHGYTSPSFRAVSYFKFPPAVECWCWRWRAPRPCVFSPFVVLSVVCVRHPSTPPFALAVEAVPLGIFSLISALRLFACC
jgi:hypothetical protein